MLTKRKREFLRAIVPFNQQATTCSKHPSSKVLTETTTADNALTECLLPGGMKNEHPLTDLRGSSTVRKLTDTYVTQPVKQASL